MILYFLNIYTLLLFIVGNTDYGNEEFESRRIVITNLEKYEKYCAKVRGGTIVDVGPFSEEVCVYTDQDGTSALILFYNILAIRNQVLGYGKKIINFRAE